MIKRILIFILILIAILPLQAQSTPEELGERIFELFKNESYNFRELLPTQDQLIDLVESKDPELVQNRADDFRKEYPNLVKKFNIKCREILEAGAAIGITWQDIMLISIKPYKKTINLKYEDKSAAVEITKLCINFSSGQQEFSLVFDAVVEYGDQYLVSNDAIEVDEVVRK
jgi:hypothetical protein